MMTREEMTNLLNGDLCNEWKHMHFYMHSANVLLGIERFFLVDVLKEHAVSEMQHVFEFAHKIRALGGIPVSTPNPYPTDLYNAKHVVSYALEMEAEVVANYHKRHKQAEELGDISIVIMLEDQIEHSQKDIDELTQIKWGL